MPAKVVNRFLERSAIKFICAGSTSSKKLMAILKIRFLRRSSGSETFSILRVSQPKFWWMR